VRLQHPRIPEFSQSGRCSHGEILRDSRHLSQSLCFNQCFCQTLRLSLASASAIAPRAMCTGICLRLPSRAVAMRRSIHVCLVEIGLFSSKDICLRASEELATTGERTFATQSKAAGQAGEHGFGLSPSAKEKDDALSACGPGPGPCLSVETQRHSWYSMCVASLGLGLGLSAQCSQRPRKSQLLETANIRAAPRGEFRDGT